MGDIISEVIFRPVSVYVVTPIQSRIKSPRVLEVISQLDGAMIMDLLY